MFDTFSNEQLHQFRRENRDARIEIQKDSENFMPLIHTLEKFGSILYYKKFGKRVFGLGNYKNVFLEEIVNASKKDKEDFESIFSYITISRNNLIHEGITARNMALKLVELSIMLERLTVKEKVKVKDIMVTNPILAEKFDRIKDLRKKILINGFSYLPIMHNDEWCILSDYQIAQLLRINKEDEEQTLEDIYNKHGITLEKAITINKEALVETIIEKINNKIVLVLEGNNIIGIVTIQDTLY